MEWYEYRLNRVEYPDGILFISIENDVYGMPVIGVYERTTSDDSIPREISIIYDKDVIDRIPVVIRIHETDIQNHYSYNMKDPLVSGSMRG